MACAGVGDESGQMKNRPAIVWLVLGASILAAALLLAETPSTDPNGVLQLTATSANVSGAPDPVRIEILRWSTDDERERLMDAWNLKPSRGSGAGKAAGKQGRGAAKGRGPAARNREPNHSRGLARKGTG